MRYRFADRLACALDFQPKIIFIAKSEVALRVKAIS
jgi:hypothetical protein